MKHLIAAVIVLTFALPAASARAADSPQNIVDSALVTFNNMTSDPNFSNINSLLDRAKAIIIVPDMFKAGFIIGGQFGNAVLLAHSGDGSWSPVAFLKMGAGSVGLQIGASVSKVVLVVMTEGGLNAILANKVTLGGEASVAAGPVGAGVAAQTTTDVGADVYSYTKGQGLFVGASLEGAVIEPDSERNKLYYGRAVTLADIVINRIVDNAGGNQLRAVLAGY
jgi:lipid-binding SYLF domain-containing protein